jgi:transposase InsO family protein
MREHDLQPKRRRRFVATTDSDHDCLIFPDLTHNRIVDGPNQLWVADITYIAIVGRLRTDTASRARACVSRCPMALQQTTKAHRQNPDSESPPGESAPSPARLGSPRGQAVLSALEPPQTVMRINNDAVAQGGQSVLVLAGAGEVAGSSPASVTISMKKER